MARSPSRPGCGRRLLRWSLVAGLIVLVLLVAVALYLRSEDFQQRVGESAKLVVDQATGEELVPGRVEIGWFPPAVALRDTKLVHPPTGDVIAEVAYARVPFDFWNLRAGAIEVVQPRVHLHLDEDGLRELRDRMRPSGEGKGLSLSRMPFGSLAIDSAHLQLDTPRGSIRLAFDLEPLGGPLHRLDGGLNVAQDTFATTVRIRSDAVQIGPDRIRIPTITAVGGPLDLEVHGDVPLQGPLDLTLAAALDLDATAGILPAPRALHGRIAANARITGRTPQVHADLTVEQLGIEVPGKRTPVLHYTLGDAEAALHLHDQQLDIDALHWAWGGGTFDAVGIVDPVEKQLVRADVVGDAVHLRQILMAMDVAPNPWIDFEGFAEITASGPLDPVAIDGDFWLRTNDLRVSAGPVHLKSSAPMLDMEHARARGKLHLAKDHIRLDAPWIRGPVTRGRADVTIGFGPQGPLDAKIDAFGAHLADFGPLGGVELTGDGPIDGRIWGPFDQLQFAGKGDIHGFSVLGLPFADHLVAPIFRSPDMKQIVIEDATATVGASTYTGDFRIDFRPPLSLYADLALRNGRIQDISGIFLDLDGVEGGIDGELAFGGPLDAMNADAAFTLEDVSIFGEHFDEGLALGGMQDGLFTLSRGSLERHDRAERLTLGGTVGAGWALDMQLDTYGFRLERMNALEGVPVEGDLLLSARLGNTLFVPDPKGQLVTSGMRFADRALPDSIALFESTDGKLRLDASLLDKAIRTRGTVPLYSGDPYLLRAELDRVPLHLLYPEAVDGTPIEAVTSGSVQLAGVLGEAQPRSLFADLDPVVVRWDRHTLTNSHPWAIRREGDVIELERFDLVGGKTRLALGGRIGEEVELVGGGTVDLDLLRVVTPGLQRAEGIARVELETRGPGAETRVDVDVDATLLRHETVPAAFEDLRAKVVLHPDRFVISDLTAGIGGGSLTGGGTIRADHWLPTRYDLSAKIRDAQVKWVDALPAAIGRADLAFDGPAGALLLHGDVTVEEMVFADRIDWEDWVIEYREDVVVDAATMTDEPGLFALDVHIEADETVRLQNNLAEGAATADLRLIGDTARTGLLGEIVVDDALVFLQDREFRVDRGRISYRDPWSWNPDVDFELITDVQRRDQRYRIAYSIFGPFSDWHTASRSEPGLPQADVNALLWFGVTTEDLQQAGELPTAVAQGVADLLLTDLLASTQASELGEVPELFFDSLDVATGVNGRGEYSAEPRLVVRKRLEEFGDVELTWEFNLGRPEDNYVRVDKRIGDIWSIAGWYATLQRDRVLPIGGAYGVDLAARWEWD